MNDLTQLLVGILSQYFIKLRKASIVAWSVLVAVISLLFAAFSGTIGIPLPESWNVFIEQYKTIALVILAVILQAIAMTKDLLIKEAISGVSDSTATNTRSLLDNNEHPTIDVKKLERALKI